MCASLRRRSNSAPAAGRIEAGRENLNSGSVDSRKMAGPLNMPSCGRPISPPYARRPQTPFSKASFRLGWRKTKSPIPSQSCNGRWLSRYAMSSTVQAWTHPRFVFSTTKARSRSCTTRFTVRYSPQVPPVPDRPVEPSGNYQPIIVTMPAGGGADIAVPSSWIAWSAAAHVS